MIDVEKILDMDEKSNNILAAGGVYMVLAQGGLEPEIIYENGGATNSIAIKLRFMKSRYKITVERISDDEIDPSDQENWSGT